MEPDPNAVEDMIRAIDEAVRTLPESLSYIVLSRYMPPGAAKIERDDLGRLYALVSEETIARIETVPLHRVPAPAYHGIPIVRVVEAA